MSCGNQVTDTEYDKIIKSINKSIIEIKMSIVIYKDLHTLSSNNQNKSILKSIIIDKNSHLNMLQEIYRLASGENNTIVVKPKCIDKEKIVLQINNSIKKEFEFINLLKILRNIIPNENLKYAINIILIDQNNIINKLMYINQKK